VKHGVELGYRVVEEQIRQGQRIAEQLNDRSYAPNMVAGELREVGERALRYLGDLGALYIDFLAGLASDGELVDRIYGAWQRPRAPSTGPSHNDTLAVCIDVLCIRPTHVVLDLRPHSEAMLLVCQELRALNAGTPPLTDVGFERTDDGRLKLRVRVPDAQPPGTYIGAIIDSGTVEPRGTFVLS
jgi:hypothetical protein